MGSPFPSRSAVMPTQMLIGNFWSSGGQEAPPEFQTSPRPFEDQVPLFQSASPYHPGGQTAGVIVPTQHKQAPPMGSGYAFAPVFAERNAEGKTVVRPQGQLVFVANGQPLALVPHDGNVARREELLPLRARLLTHLPLGEQDDPDTYEGQQRTCFRNLFNNVNELDRIIPDLDVAKSHTWQSKIAKLIKHIRALEQQIQGPLRRNVDCPVFRKLIPTYPQLWKYIGTDQRRELNKEVKPSRRQLRADRMIEATPGPVKDEYSNDDVLEATTSLRCLISTSTWVPRSFELIKQEGDDQCHSNIGTRQHNL